MQERFLSCFDPIDDDDIEYIYHTQKPRVLFKLIRSSLEHYKYDDYEIVEEYDSLEMCTKEQIEELMTALKNWRIEMYYQYHGNEDEEMEYEEYTYGYNIVELDDAYMTNFINNEGYNLPTKEELDSIDLLDKVKVSKMGEKFWCVVMEHSLTRNSFLSIIREDLYYTSGHGLKLSDLIVIEKQHIYEIEKREPII